MTKVSLAAGLGAASLLAAALLLITLAAPTSIVARLVNALVPVPDLAESQYETALALAKSASEPQRSQAIRTAETAAIAEIRAAPRRADAWLRLAVARALEGGDLTGAVAALKGSYQTARYDRHFGATRIRFALEAWPSLPQDLKDATLSEIKVLYRSARSDTATHDKARLIAAVLGVQNPAGRAAGEAALVLLGWTPPEPPPTGSPAPG